MVDKTPLLVIILVVVFLITSLMTFIAMDNVIAPEKVEVQKQPSSAAGGIVKIDIVQPEKEGVNNEANIQ